MTLISVLYLDEAQMAKGLIMIDRALFDHPRYKPKTSFSKLEAWLWMIGEASWKKRQIEIVGHLVTLERGQLSASYRFMAQKLGWTMKTVRTFIHQLSLDGSIVVETDTGQTVITISNYEKYQSFDEYKGTRRALQGHSKGTAGAQTITPEETPEETTENTANSKWRRNEGNQCLGKIEKRRSGNGFMAISAKIEEGYEDEW